MRFAYILATSSLLALSGAALFTPPSVTAAPVQCPDTWGGTIKCDYYKDGYKAGRRDRSSGLSNAYERHEGKYDSRNASYFQAGYEEGWGGSAPAPSASIKCPDTWTGGKCEYFRDGYKAGKSDRRANLSNYYGRHNGAYDSRNESYYQEGYEAGWEGRTY